MIKAQLETLNWLKNFTTQNFSVSQLETGPVFECVRFSIYGRSPLFQHYLYHHNLTEAQKTPGLAVSRTQIKEIPQDGITYRQVLKGQQKKAKNLYQEYQRYVVKALQSHSKTIGVDFSLCSQVAQNHRELAQVRNKHITQVRKTEK